MGWSVGIGKDGRDIGYGVPALCDHPDCNVEIDRGLSFVCGMINTDGEDRGCGLHFCTDHLRQSPKFGQLCFRCWPRQRAPFTRKDDVAEWVRHKLTDPTWQAWRDENPELAEAMHSRLCDGCEPEPCEYCAPGIRTGLPGNACENCMNTGLKYPEQES